MSHAEFNDAWMGAFGSQNRTPGTSRVEKKYVSKRLATPRTAPNRKIVRVEKYRGHTYTVHLKASGVLIGWLEKDGKGWSYRLRGEGKVGGQFPTQKACVERMLTKI
jgi:hypothetical protein